MPIYSSTDSAYGFYLYLLFIINIINYNFYFDIFYLFVKLISMHFLLLRGNYKILFSATNDFKEDTFIVKDGFFAVYSLWYKATNNYDAAKNTGYEHITIKKVRIACTNYIVV